MQVGALYVSSQNVQVWHEVASAMPWGTDWIAAGVAQTATGAPGPGIRTASITGWSWFSPFAVSNINFPLPLKLLAFNAIKVNSGMANLTWELASVALPGASFEVEKSADGRNFTSFASVTASTTNRFYILNDTRLGKGVTYYRLKMIDADGKASYGKTVAVINENTGLYITNLAPNPVTNHSTLTISAAKKGTVSFEIYTMTGAVVKKWNATLAEGTNTITIPVGALPSGIYQLRATGQDASSVIRMVKQ